MGSKRLRMGLSTLLKLYKVSLKASLSAKVIRRTNSKTVTAWLVIDLLISLGLGLYYFFFRYVSALGWAPFQWMLKNKFFIVLAGFRAARSPLTNSMCRGLLHSLGYLFCTLSEREACEAASRSH